MAEASEIVKEQRRAAPEVWPVEPPACDVYENKDELLILADLPGVTAEALRIHLEKGELTIEARRGLNGQGTVIGAEIRDVQYRRRFAVPGGIDAERITAELLNGVLHLHLPKSDALKPRQIEVRAG